MPVANRDGGLHRGTLFDTNVPATTIDKDIFTDQEVEETIAGDDLVLMLDVSEDPDKIKYMTRTNFVSGLSGSTITVTDNESTNENNLVTFVADAGSSTGLHAIEMDGDFHYNPSTGTVTASNFSGTATLATSITASANNSTDETVYPTFVDAATGTQGIETDTGLTYNPSSGILTATQFTGAVSGNASTATALATGRTISMTGDVVWTSASFDGSGNVTGSATIQANSVALGTDTTGNYVQSIADAGNSTITVTNGTAEGGAVTLDLAAAQTTITSILATDLKIGEDNQTKIDFETANQINFYADNANQIILQDGALIPANDNDIDLGTSSVEFKDAYFDGTVTSDAFAGPLTGNASTATALETARTIGGVSFDGTGNINLPGVNTAGNQNTSGTAAVATTVTITDNESTNEDNAIIFTAGGDVDGGNIGLESDGTLTYNPSTGKITATGFIGTLTGDVTGNVTGNTSGTAATVTGAAQTNITSLGTLTALTVDDVAIDGKVVTMTGSTSDTAVFTVGTNGTLSIVTTDDAAAAANIQITADGTVDIDSAGVLTLDSGAAINLEPAAGSAVLIDGTVSIDGGAVTGVSTLTASGVITAGGFTIGSAAILEAELEILDGASVTTDELNLLDGDTSVGGSITLADTDGFIVNDDGTMKTIPATDISAYVTAEGAMSNWVLEDGDGTEVTITNTKEIKFVEGGGVDINWTDTDNGTDADPYDLTFTINAAQTDITSIYATDLILGEDSQTAIDFGTPNEIDFKADNAARLTLTSSALYPVTDNEIDLGTSTLEFKDAFFDGTVTADAFAGPLTGNVTGTADVATTVTITDNENTNENNAIIFTAGGDLDGGNLGLESDGDLHYNPSTGLLTTTGVTASGTVTYGSLSDGTITVTAWVDEDDMASDSATLIPTQQSVKAYIDNNAGTMSSFFLEDDDGTEVTVNNAKEIKFIGSGVTTNWTDTSTGSDGDPYDMTITVDAAQTGITSIYATDLILGEDSQTAIDFGTPNEIDFKADNAARLTLTSSALYPVTDNEIDLGTASLEFKDAFFDGTVTADAFAGPLTGDVTGTADVATVATTVTITDNESTDEDNAIIFTAGGDVDGGNLGLESDGDLIYNPSTGRLTATQLAGTLQTAAQTNVTSVGTLGGGSISSGFGNIDIGSSNLTATGSVSLGATSFNDNNITNVGSVALDTITSDGSAVGFGTDGSGEDVYFYSATAGDNMFWDASDEKLVITGTNGQNSLEVADGNVTITDNLTVSGDFTVSGTTTTVDTTNLTVTDPLIKLAQGTTASPANDLGIIFTRGNGSSTNIANRGILWDESADEFAFANTNDEDGTTTGNVDLDDYANIHVGVITADDTSVFSGSIELGHATDTTIARSGSGDITIEGNAVYRAGGTDVAVADGGTGSGTASGARSNLGLGTAAVAATGISNTNVPVFTSGVADNDFLRVDGTSIEGRSASEVASDIGAATVGLSVAMAIAL